MPGLLGKKFPAPVGTLLVIPRSLIAGFVANSMQQRDQWRRFSLLVSLPRPRHQLYPPGVV